MRIHSGSPIRRTGFACLLAGFAAGLATMALIGMSNNAGKSHQRLSDEHDGHVHMHHGHHHEHVHAEDTAIDRGTVLKQEPNGHDDSEGTHKAVDLSALDRHMHSGGATNCKYTWSAVAHRHVSGGVLDSEAKTVEQCLQACINKTTCQGVDFNSGSQCWLIVDSSSGSEKNHVHHENTPEEEKGCVHYNLKRTCGAAADDDTVARSLYSAVRVLCWVMTTPENHMSKAVHVQATWGRRCNKLLFVTEKNDVGALPIVQVDVDTGREHLTAKTMSAFDHVFEHHFDDADWFMKADDDTFVIMENLRYFLSGQDPNEPIYFGHHFGVIVKQGYFSGGAGYVLSREALKRFGQRPKGTCNSDHGAEDVEIGSCMERLGVKTGDSRDSLGRSRFHCFNPETHIHGGYPDWYLKYDKYGAAKGIESISDYAISFHYVSVEQLYNLEFYVYHMRPYGIISGLQELNQLTPTQSEQLKKKKSALADSSEKGDGPVTTAEVV